MGDFSVKMGSEKEWTIVSWEHMNSDKGMIEGNNCLTSAVEMICTYPTQNLSRPNYQDAWHGNSLTNKPTAKLTIIWSAGNLSRI